MTIIISHKSFFDLFYLQLFINNEWVNSLSGETFKTMNPTTEEVITEVQKGGKVKVLVLVLNFI